MDDAVKNCAFVHSSIGHVNEGGFECMLLNAIQNYDHLLNEKKTIFPIKILVTIIFNMIIEN